MGPFDVRRIISRWVAATKLLNAGFGLRNDLAVVLLSYLIGRHWTMLSKPSKQLKHCRRPPKLAGGVNVPAYN